MLLHPNAKSVLAVGLGAGVTLRGVSNLDPAQIDCVEISPSVVQASKFFAAENGRIFENPKVHFIIDDARHFMNASPARYDLIVLDILFPMSSGTSTVFSREYFQLCKNRLQPGGMVCQWLPIHQLSLEQIKTIVATFQSVFPHTSLWFGTIGDDGAAIGCIGTEQPLLIDVEQLRNRMKNPAISVELRQVNLQSPSLLLSHFIMAEEDVAKFCSGAALDTDDRPIIEFAAPKLAVKSSRQGILNLVELSRATQDIRPLVTSVPDDLARYVEGKKVVIDGLLRLEYYGDEDVQMRMYRAALTKDPLNEDLQCLTSEK
jgi:spermidine synthase